MVSGGPGITVYLNFVKDGNPNSNTQQAYVRAAQLFLSWLRSRGITQLEDVEPWMVGAYIEQLRDCGLPAEVVLPVWRGREHQKGRRPYVDRPYSISTIKLHVSAIRKMFAQLCTGNPRVLAENPATNAKPPTLIRQEGVTPSWESEDFHQLLDSIPDDTSSGIRDRAIILTMTCSFARIGALLNMTVDDYRPGRKHRTLHLVEKGTKVRDIPVHFKVQRAIDLYIERGRH